MYAKDAIQDIYFLTPMQESMVFHKKFSESDNNEAYFQQISCSIEGNLNIDCFGRTVDHLVEKYDILRTAFLYKGVSKPVQIILKKRKVNISYTDISNQNIDVNHYLEEYKRVDKEKGFDLLKEPLVRLSIIKEKENIFYIIFSFHHIILDGWSLSNLLLETKRIYTEVLMGNQVTTEQTTPFGKYIAWIEKQDKASAVEYWRKYLGDYNRKAKLLQHNQVIPFSNDSFKKVVHVIGKEKTQKIGSLAKSLGISLATLVNTLWGIVLQKYNNSDDVVFTNVISGRDATIDGIEEIVGMFINSIPVRIRNDGYLTLKELLIKVNNEALMSNEHSHLSLSEIQSLSDLKNNLIDNVLVFENYPMDKNLFKSTDERLNFALDNVEAKGHSNYDFNLTVYATDEIILSANFNQSQYDTQYIGNVLESIEKVADAMIGNINSSVADVAIITNKQKNEVLTHSFATKVEVPEDETETVDQIISKRMIENSGKLAVVYGEEKLTYKDLGIRTNQLARYLLKYGCKKGDIIGVYADRSIEMLVALVAIIKAGGVYLPLNKYYSDNMLNDILEESNVKRVLKHSENHLNVNEKSRIINIHLENGDVYSESGNEIQSISQGEDLLYLLYTSGTTGKAKGVGVEHNQLINTIKGLEEVIYKKYKPGLNIGLVAPSFFDASIKQIFASLLLGHTLFITDEQTRFSGEMLLNFIVSEGIDIIDGTPAHINMMCSNYENLNKTNLHQFKLKNFLVGGEKLKIEDARDFLSKYQNGNLEVTNLYGLTECTVDTTAFVINIENMSSIKEVPIGKPLFNQSILILDKDRKLVPIGVNGEIYIGGKSVATGYIYEPKLNEESYVNIPEFEDEVFYKTGDLGKWGSDGNVLYIGRLDSQIKLRAYRIELLEIEHSIRKYNSINEVVVLKNESDRTEYICAYFVSNKEIEIMDLRNFLVDKMPQYMIPSIFQQVEGIPLKGNGKVDTVALKRIGNAANVSYYYEAPRNMNEVKLAELWKSILKIEKISIRDNFFSIGGHSLKAMDLLMQITKNFQVEVPFKYFFSHPTIYGLSEYMLKEEKISTYKNIEPALKKDYYPVSSPQKRMYTFFKYDPDSMVYNIANAYKVMGKVDLSRLQKALNRLVDRHKVLRTTYEEKDLAVVQKIGNYQFASINHKRISRPEENCKTQVLNKYLRPFNLNKEVGWEVHLLEISVDEYLLLLNMHHISFDGISVNLFVKELFAMYNGKALPDNNVQYNDYSEWEIENDKEEHYKDAEKYWLETLKDDLPILNFPLDYRRPDWPDYSGSRLNFKIGEKTLKTLKDVALETESTLYTVLFSMFTLLLYKYTGQKDFLTGTVSSGRTHTDVKKTLGMFVSTFAIRTKIDEDSDISSYIKMQMKNILGALEFQDYHFENVLKLKDVKVEKNRNPLFDVLFSMNNLEESIVSNLGDSSNLVVKPEHIDNAFSKFDFALIGTENKSHLSFDLEYSNQLFKKESMEGFVRQFENLLYNLSDNYEKKLLEIELIGELEKEIILHQFNNIGDQYRSTQTIVELFEEQCALNPYKRALVYKGQSISYKILNEKANQIANVLKEKKVQEETVVGIAMEQGFNRIVGILGILKAGGAFLPIDEDYPEERMEFMLGDSNSKLLLTDKQFPVNFSVIEEVIDMTKLSLGKVDKTNLEIPITSNNLAYIMYTSGSTGKPKGVLVEHKNIVRLVKDTNYINFKDTDRILQGSTIVFDASTFEIWGALLNGLELHLIDKKTLLNAKKLEKTLKEENITIMWMTAPLFNQISRRNPSIFKHIRYLLVGGDSLSVEPIEQVRNICKGLKIVNGYGPTENTTFSTTFHIDKKFTRNIPIGRPISNSTAFIMDSHMHLQPIGAIGEIFVGGEGVSRGYVNNELLNKERFLENPFVHGDRLYRTGDLGRWLTDGNIEYLGRKDQQVKIRGFRIEPGEIESTLLMHELVSEAVVIVRVKASNEKYLSAFVVLKKDSDESGIKSVIEHLRSKLPGYMQPSTIIEMAALPLSANGKIDKEALLSIQRKPIKEELEEPINEIEKQLLTIWREVFQQEDIGVKDHFYDLGGNSLLAIELLAKVKNEFYIDVTIKELFTESNIKNIGAWIINSEKANFHKIPKSNEKEYYAVTLVQENLYALSAMDENNIAYNMPTVLMLKGQLDIEVLKLSYEKLINRHESFRTSFHTIGNEIVQKIKEYDQSTLFNFEYKSLGKKDLRAELLESINPFRLDTPPLIKMKLIQLKSDSYALLVDMHHIISDGISVNLFIDEFFELYNGNGLAELKPLEIQHRDYAEWQKTLYGKSFMAEREKYWLQQFEDFQELNLPYDYVKTNKQRFDGEVVELAFSQEVGKKIKEVAKSLRCTPNTILLSAYYVLLSKYSQQQDIILGTAVNGRKYKELSNNIGMYTKMIPLQNSVSGNKTFNSLLNEVQDTLYKAIDFQEYEVEKILKNPAIHKNYGRNVLFDTVFTFEQKNDYSRMLKGLEVSMYSLPFNLAKFDLVFLLSELSDKFSLHVQYNTNHFKNATVMNMAKHYKNIVHQIINGVDMKIDDIELMCSKERKKILYDFNYTRNEYQKDSGTILDIFELTVGRFPHKVAIVSNEKSLTYRELNEQSNKIANALLTKGVSRNSIVALLMEADTDMLIAMLGILKAGAAFLPIDPEYPYNQMKYIVNDSNAIMLITKRELIKDLSFNNTTILMDDLQSSSFDGRDLNSVNDGSDLAYVIYTSGTSGNPKGVEIEHRSLLNLCNWHNNQFEITSDDRASKYAGVGFDASVWEVFPYILKGASVFIIEESLKLEINRMNGFFERNKITISFLPTQICEEFIKLSNKSLRILLTGGDRLKNVIPTDYKLVNNYGPTENTVVTTSYLVERNDKNIPIGKPISNTQIYILNHNNKLLPIGIPGELCISGDGIARGYVNNPKLTNEKFVENPFIKGTKMYRTGDIAKWNEDGNIVFLGRMDDQIKIRGYRVEISQIEAALLKNQNIENAVVVPNKDQKNNTLSAYIISKNKMDSYELRSFLKSELPNYMIPTHFYSLDEMPITQNGKINRARLPEVVTSELISIGKDMPSTELERQIVELWRAVLSREDFGVSDDFFDLGGDSLKAVYLLGDIREKLNLNSSVSEIFEMSTIKEYAKSLESRGLPSYSPLDELINNENNGVVYPLASAQKRIFIIDYFNDGNVQYNMPIAYKLTGELDIIKVGMIFRALIERHEALRASFTIMNNEPVQKILPDLKFSIKTIQSAEENITDVLNSLIKPFHLKTSSLIRVAIVKVSNEKHFLFVDTHHIVSDGVSIEILMEEFIDMYQGKELPILKRNFGGFVRWQDRQVKNNLLTEQNDFWKETLTGYRSKEVLPLDYPRDMGEEIKSNNIQFTLSDELTSKLRELMKKFKCTPFVLLTAIYVVLLHKYSNTKDIIVGCAAAGRQHPNSKRIVGMFTNTLPIRYLLNNEMRFDEFLDESKRTILNAFDNQDFQLNEIVDDLEIERQAGKMPLIDTLFQFQSFKQTDIKVSGLKIEPQDIGVVTSKFDFEIFVQETADVFTFSINYRKHLFNDETIQNLMKDYKLLIQKISQDPSQIIKNIEIFSLDHSRKKETEILEFGGFRF